MAAARKILPFTLLAGLVALSSGCVIHEHDHGSEAAAREEGYREGYYDREHNRYYHDNAWHDCIVNDPYCR
jgi:hypothetical protein